MNRTGNQEENANNFFAVTTRFDKNCNSKAIETGTIIR